MNIPEKVKVGGKTYRVNITDKLGLGTAHYSAEIDYVGLNINITEQAPGKMEADFLHELVHAIFDHRGVRDQQEEEVDSIAQALHMVIKDNPGIFADDRPLCIPTKSGSKHEAVFVCPFGAENLATHGEDLRHTRPKK